MSIKIYSCNDSRGLRPMWTAEEMGVSYESEMMPFPPRFLHKEYMDVNILGTIPYLIDGEVEMTESVAMCQYLVEKYGPTDLRVNSDEADFHHYLNWFVKFSSSSLFPKHLTNQYHPTKVEIESITMVQRPNTFLRLMIKPVYS